MRCEKFFLGCPVWAHAPWRGKFFTAEAKREEFLPQYASVFNTAEGNATFYGLPSADTVARWAGEAPESFRFCLKFPRTVTHDHALFGLPAREETKRFLERIAPLRGRLGPFFLQLHASFGMEKFWVLEEFLRELPEDLAFAVEMRHDEFFDGGEMEAQFDALLGELGMDRVIFDTRGLFAATASDAFTLDAQRRKPQLPVRPTATGRHPFVRFVGDPAVEKNDAALRVWAGVVARWIGEERVPYFFAHHPDDTYAPELARRFQAMLHELAPAAVPPPAVWPGERAVQMSLF